MIIITKSKKDAPANEVHKTTEVNCWFCNHNFVIDIKDANNFWCPSCHQYNGFNSDGDYTMDVPGQRDVKEYKTEGACEVGDFHSSPSVLCPACSTNQVFYVRQLAEFKPMSEEFYEEEFDSYRQYLEDVYRLCEKCEHQVKECISKQDQVLRSRMTASQLRQLELVRKKPSNSVSSPGSIDLVRFKTPHLSTLLFGACLLLALLRVLICLRLYAVGVVSRAGKPADMSAAAAWLQGSMLWLVVTIPGHWILAVEETVIYLGAGVCAAALFVCGKYSLYPEDCLHLLVWLVALVTSSTSTFFWAEWTHVSDGSALVLSALAVPLALVACCTPRQPRNVPQLALIRKKINTLRSSKQETDPNQTNSTKLASQGQKGNSHSNTSEPVSSFPFQEVCQVLETFSIGLNTKSSSKSSIWSLPAVVTSTSDADSISSLSTAAGHPAASGSIMPDSTTDDTVTPQRAGTPRSVLSPSRLGFLNFDSSPGSRSPSPWSPIVESCDYSGHEPDLWKEVYPFTTQPSSGPELASIDSAREMQTVHTPPISEHWHIHSQSHRRAGGEGRETSSQGDPTKGVRRRSKRLAMAGKLVKPWPLRKSLSCNNATDRENVERAGASSRLGRVSPPVLPPLPRNDTLTQNQVPNPNGPQQAGWLKMAPLREKTGGDFLHYRDASSPSRSNIDASPSSQPANRKLFPGSGSQATYQSVAQRASEFSDDEDMEVDELGSSIGGPRSSTHGKDMSLRWILLGTVIGASITCNIFLVLHSWLKH